MGDSVTDRWRFGESDGVDKKRVKFLFVNVIYHPQGVLRRFFTFQFCYFLIMSFLFLLPSSFLMFYRTCTLSLPFFR